MTESLPLSALLSRALVAFTIELDNTWESRVAHRTTRFGGPRGAVYGTSLAMWSNFMRAVPADGVSIAELERWVGRFGDGAVAGLRGDLEQLDGELGLADLPQWLTGHYGGYAGQALEFNRRAPAAAADEWPLPLSALLCQVLQAYALEYEAESDAPLSYSANVLRLLDEDGVRVAELPRRSGVAVEALRVAVQILAKRRFIAVGSDPSGGRLKVARLLGRGQAAQGLYRERPAGLEDGWRRRAGDATLQRLRAALEGIVTAPPGERAPMWRGLEPPPESWRSRVAAPDVLPDFPMARQSGHPDGA